MKTLKDYLTEAESHADVPTVGDDFAIEIRGECLLESYVVDTTEDGIVIAGDDRLLELLEHYGYTAEAIQRYGAVGSSPGMGYTVSETDAPVGTDPTDTKSEHDRGYADAAKGINKNPYNRDTPASRAYEKGQATFKRHFKESQELALIRSRAGLTEANADENDPLLAKAVDDAAVGPMEGTEGGRDTVEFDIPTFIRMLEYAREDAKDDMDLHDVTEKVIELSQEDRVLTMSDYDTIVGNSDEESDAMDEAKYQGREVPLGKPMAGDVKKSKVYVRGPKGNVVKVNFGDPNMRIKKSNPERRKSFRARHNCDNPGPRWKARYWSCRAW